MEHPLSSQAWKTVLCRRVQITAIKTLTMMTRKVPLTTPTSSPTKSKAAKTKSKMTGEVKTERI